MYGRKVLDYVVLTPPISLSSRLRAGEGLRASLPFTESKRSRMHVSVNKEAREWSPHLEEVAEGLYRHTRSPQPATSVPTKSLTPAAQAYPIPT